MIVAGQESVNYSYDANSRVIDVGATLSGRPVDFGISYDELGRRTSLTLPNGVTTNYTYDNASNLLNIESFNPLNQILESLNYSYDKNGNRISFNGQNTLLPEQMTASYNDANQQIQVDNEALIYDENGNLIQKGDTIYQWDARNRLIGIASPTLTASFRYDPFGRRIQKTVSDTATNTYTDTMFLYDRWDIVQEIENGTVTTNYLRSLNIDETLGIQRQDSIYYYLADALGSTIALTDSLGSIAAEYYYDPFGNTQTSNPNIYNPFQYTGRENDGNGLYHYRLRYKIGERFISQDPVRLWGGINFYSYVHNMPTRYRDPLGLLEFVYNAGGHIWFPASAGSYGFNFNSYWGAPYRNGPQYEGYSDDYTVGLLADIGATAGIRGLSDCQNGKETSINIGAGKYLGIQILLKGGKFDGVTWGFGYGLGTTITFSYPFEDFISGYK